MTQQEKAKAYDEALEIAKKELNVCGSQDCEAAKQIFRLFPELKESEDERIRKAIRLILIATEDDQKDFYETYKLTRKELTDWLEKQGEKKPAEKSELQWHDVNEHPDETRELLCEWESDDAIWHDVAFYDSKTNKFRVNKMPIDNVIRWIYVDELLQKQKPIEWSQEDEEHISTITNVLEDRKKEQTEVGVKILDDEIAWLKSIRPQPKQEWSEKDGTVLNNNYVIKELRLVSQQVENGKDAYIRKLEKELDNQSKRNLIKSLELREEPDTILSICSFLSTKISDLQFSARTYNAMMHLNIETLGDLCKLNKDKILSVRGFGKKSFTEVDDLLESLNLHLDMDVDKYYAALYKLSENESD